jgi:hypothetical protein
MFNPIVIRHQRGLNEDHQKYIFPAESMLIAKGLFKSTSGHSFLGSFKQVVYSFLQF